MAEAIFEMPILMPSARITESKGVTIGSLKESIHGRRSTGSGPLRDPLALERQAAFAAACASLK